jgi:thiol-disulfide isomerase/thioredoxin
MRSFSLLLALVLVPAATAHAERKQVFSLQGLYCVNCADELRESLADIKGVRKLEFDKVAAEITVWLADGIADDVVVAAVDRAGFHAVAGAGQGAWRADAKPWPEGADVKVLTRDGSAVGSFAKLRVPGKYTVFDVYADWCMPCRDVDEQLRTVLATRKDVAVRKLNIVDFESPLGLELGDAIQGLPWVVVYSPAGKRTEITGLNPEKLAKALSR